MGSTGYRCTADETVVADPSACDAMDASFPAPDGGDGGADSDGGCAGACTPGASSCTRGLVSECVEDAETGCFGWSLATRCDSGECADSETCAACVDGCPSDGETECSGGLLRTCELAEDGCLAWSAPAACLFDSCADSRSCATCEDTCPADGATECEGDSLRTCELASNGCLAWSATTACVEGFCADATRCGTCAHTCPVDGAIECTTGHTRTCVADVHGCRGWTGSTPCAEGFCADATRCGTCDDRCPSAGTRSCEAGALRTCQADANGCLDWSAAAACPDGFCADAATCGTCTHECTTLGATECTGGALRTCMADANGCRAWDAPMACGDGFCEDATSCGMCAHECGAVGLSCAADDLARCVADARGCRYEVRAACGTGCAAGACEACTSHRDPVVGELPGIDSGGRRLVRVGSLLYVPTYGSLDIVDVSDPTAPVLVSSYPGAARDVAVVGSHAFAVAPGTGLTVLDVSTPSAPAHVATLAISGGPGTIVVAGGYAYVLGDALSIVDVRTPSSPAIVGSQGRPGDGEDLVIIGDRAFLTDTVNGVRVVDVSVKSAPALVGAIPLGAAYRYQGLAAIGTQLLVTAMFNGATVTYALHSFDTAAPGMPRTGSVPLETSGSSLGHIHVAGDRAYIAGPSSVPVLDVSDPAHPMDVERVQCPWPQALRLNDLGDGRHLVCLRLDLLSIVDLQQGARWIGTTAHADVRTLVAAPGLLLVGARGLSIYDVSDPAGPVPLATWGTAQVHDLVVDGDLAYVGFTGRTEIVSFADPRAPVLVGTIPVSGLEIALLAGHAYVLEGSNVSVWRVSTPSAPVRIGSLYPATTDVNSVVAAGSIIVVGRRYTIDTFLVTTPSAPLVAGSLSGGGIVLHGEPGVVYAAGDSWTTGDDYLRIVDVNDPSTPTIVGSLPDYDPNAFVVAGDYGYGLYLANVGIVDLSVPSAPVLVEEVSLSGWASSQDLAVQGAYLFANIDDGIASVRACR